jgi:hypothetical protein
VLNFKGESRIPVNEDHFGICKFSTKDEPRYRDVWVNLQDIVSDALKTVPSTAG